MMGLRLLYRDWRGGDVTILLVALALAVAIVTGLGIFSERLGNAISAQSTRLLGADMVVESPRPMGPVDAGHGRGGGAGAVRARFRSPLWRRPLIASRLAA